MQKLKNILVYVDRFSKMRPVLQRAVKLATFNHGRVTLCGVLPQETEPLPSRLNLHELAREELQRRLDTLAQKYSTDDVPIRVRLRTGVVFVELIREVLEHHHDVLMIVAEGEIGIRERLFGSTTMHLMRKCPCAVWAFRSDAGARFKQIIAAVDLVRDDPSRLGLNRRIMELGTSLARAENATLHVVHAWQVPHETTLRRRTDMPKHQLNALVEEIRQRHEQRLNELLALFPMNEIKHRVHLLKWPAHVAIDHVARMHRCDLIVMGTVGRTGLAGFFIGNTAETVLSESRCSVLAVKPPSFQSPVQLA